MESKRKVEGWLLYRQESDTIHLEKQNTSVTLVRKWTLDHVQVGPEYIMVANRVTVSETGDIGTSCFENASLAVMFPDTDKASIVLAENEVYRSATFVKIDGKEYLAAAFNQDGCLYLWDMESKTSRKVFDPRLPSEQLYKYMMIFKIDESTIGYGEVMSSPVGSRRVFILQMNTRDWNLTATLKLFTPHDIWDMCYGKVDDGTPLLFLCIPHDNSIMAVEMIGGRTRWEVGKQQMGETFEPWSICTDDESKTAYIADIRQNKVHMLSASDGTTVGWFNPGYHGIWSIFTVRFYDQHLYVEHRNQESKYAIVKFKLTEKY